MNTIELLLVRHGEAMDDVNDTIGGEADDALTDRGLEQARLLATRLAATPLRALYASTLARAARTAEILSTRLGVQPVMLPDLAEKRVGVLAGMRREEAFAKYPELWREGGRSLVPKGAESFAEFFSRIRGCLDRIRGAHTDGGQILLVSHGGPINVILQVLLGIDLDRFPVFSLGDASLTHITLRPDKVMIRFVNSTRHLDAR